MKLRYIIEVKQPIIEALIEEYNIKTVEEMRIAAAVLFSALKRELDDEEFDVKFEVEDDAEKSEDEYMQHLSKWLINSGEDCCSKCAHCSKNELCDNLADEGGRVNYEVCYNGMKEYYEKHKEE